MGVPFFFKLNLRSEDCFLSFELPDLSFLQPWSSHGFQVWDPRKGYLANHIFFLLCYLPMLIIRNGKTKFECTIGHPGDPRSLLGLDTHRGSGNMGRSMSDVQATKVSIQNRWSLIHGYIKPSFPSLHTLASLRPLWPSTRMAERSVWIARWGFNVLSHTLHHKGQSVVKKPACDDCWQAGLMRVASVWLGGVSTVQH